MMKWATIISGQPRAKLKESKEEYDVFVSGLESKPDIFGHIWESEKLLSSWGPRGWLGAAGKEGTTVTFSSDETLDVWKPNKCIVENYDDHESNDRTVLLFVHGLVYFLGTLALVNFYKMP